MEDGIIYHPLKEYNDLLKDAHKQNVEEYFDNLVQQAGTDIEANHATIKKRNELSSQATAADKYVKKFKILRTLLIVLIVAAVIAAVAVIMVSQNSTLKIVVPIACGVAAVGFIVLIAVVINKKIKSGSDQLSELKKQIKEVEDEAAEQMASLNNLFAYNMCEDLVAKTLPLIRIDKQFDAEKFSYFTDKAIKELDETASVVEVRTGNSGGNPFMIARFLDQDFVNQAYTGSLRVEWTETERDSQGNIRVVTKSEVLHATIYKPKPHYYTGRCLYYGNDAVPDLHFSRSPVVPAGSSDKDIEKIVKKGEKELEKLTREAVKHGGNFNKLGNSEFEVLFGATDRDNEVQFRMAFTPLAQQSEVELIRHDDYFSMSKAGKLNIVFPATGSEIIEPSTFTGIDYEAVRANFIKFNEKYFKDVYFSFAPLFAIPIYQTDKPEHSYGYNETRQALSAWEIEANIYRLENDLRPADSAVDNTIIRVERVRPAGEDGVGGSCPSVIIDTMSYAFRGEERVEYVPAHCRNGRTYNVPVPWIEYIPIQSAASIRVDEASNVPEDETIVHGLKYTML